MRARLLLSRTIPGSDAGNIVHLQHLRRGNRCPGFTPAVAGPHIGSGVGDGLSWSVRQLARKRQLNVAYALVRAASRLSRRPRSTSEIPADCGQTGFNLLSRTGRNVARIFLSSLCCRTEQSDRMVLSKSVLPCVPPRFSSNEAQASRKSRRGTQECVRHVRSVSTSSVPGAGCRGRCGDTDW
jgi:hypothetical protein